MPIKYSIFKVFCKFSNFDFTDEGTCVIIHVSVYKLGFVEEFEKVTSLQKREGKPLPYRVCADFIGVAAKL